MPSETTKKRSKRELAFYLSAAVASFASDFFTFSALVFWNVNIYYAQGIARVVGGIVSFMINRNYSFKSENSRAFVQARRFVLQYILAYNLSIFLLWLFHEVLHINPTPAKLLGDFVCFVFNFFCMKLYTYNSKTGMIQLTKSLYKKSVTK